MWALGSSGDCAPAHAVTHAAGSQHKHLRARTISLSMNVLAKSLFLLGCLGDPSPGAKTPWMGGCRAMWCGSKGSEGMALQMEEGGRGGGK